VYPAGGRHRTAGGGEPGAAGRQAAEADPCETENGRQAGRCRQAETAGRW